MPSPSPLPLPDIRLLAAQGPACTASPQPCVFSKGPPSCLWPSVCSALHLHQPRHHPHPDASRASWADKNSQSSPSPPTHLPQVSFRSGNDALHPLTPPMWPAPGAALRLFLASLSKVSSELVSFFPPLLRPPGLGPASLSGSLLPPCSTWPSQNAAEALLCLGCSGSPHGMHRGLQGPSCLWPCLARGCACKVSLLST